MMIMSERNGGLKVSRRLTKQECMDFDIIINRCIEVFSNAKSSDPYCLRRYAALVSLLTKMRKTVKTGTFPRNYPVLPYFNFIERRMDSYEMYESLKALDDWYAKNYRSKSEAILRREQIKEYLHSDGGFSEQRVDMIISNLARHKDIYLEFAEYAAKQEFPLNGVKVSGYDAATLHHNYPLSPLRAYIYLIYLRETPEKALADLKAGLPRK